MQQNKKLNRYKNDSMHKSPKFRIWLIMGRMPLLYLGRMMKISLPNIPDINPDITLNRCESINLLLSSIAMEEIGLSHILNAEGEKIKASLRKKDLCITDYYTLNEQVNNVLRSVIRSQLLLQLKLEDVITIIHKDKSCKVKNKCHSPCPTCKSTHCKNPCNLCKDCYK